MRLKPELTVEIHFGEGIVTSYKPGLKYELGLMFESVTTILRELPEIS
jgi:hypothetical protein